MKILPRIMEARVRRVLERQKSVLLLGPRQTGKTTWLQLLQPDLLLNFLRPRSGSVTNGRRNCWARSSRRWPGARGDVSLWWPSMKYSACRNW